MGSWIPLCLTLLGPVAALADLEVAYIFADRACAIGDMGPVHLTWLASLAAACTGAWLARREWRRWGADAPQESAPAGRSRFLALLAMLSGATAALVIAAQWSAAFFFHPCQ